MRVNVPRLVVAGLSGDVEVEGAVKQLATLERRDLRNAIDRLQGRVDLQLVSSDLLVAKRACVGCFGHQTANVVQQVADLSESAVRGGDQLASAFAVRAGGFRIVDRAWERCEEMADPHFAKSRFDFLDRQP